MSKDLKLFFESKLLEYIREIAKPADIIGMEEEPSRIIGAANLTPRKIQLDIASDGLNLNQKISLEKFLLISFNKKFDDLTLHINFKRVHNYVDTKEYLDSPSEVTRKKSGTFGLTVDKRAIPGVSSVICVASGKGGVGKSTVSVNLSVTLAKLGYKTGLLDADVYGPSAPIMLGLKGPLDVSKSQRLVPLESYGVKCVSFGFMSDSYNPVIWRGPLVSKAVEQLAYDVDWGELDFLIVDLPPGTGDVQMSLIESVPISGAIIVTTPQDVALIDAHKALTMFQKLGVDVIGLVENMAVFSCNKCGEKHRIFGGEGAKLFCSERGVELLSELPLNPEVGRYSDQGKPAITCNDEIFDAFRSIVSVVEKY